MYAVVSYRADGDIESPNLYGTPKIETEPVETEDEATLDLFEEMTRIKRSGAEIINNGSVAVQVDGSNRAERIYMVEAV